MVVTWAVRRVRPHPGPSGVAIPTGPWVKPQGWQGSAVPVLVPDSMGQDVGYVGLAAPSDWRTGLQRGWSRVWAHSAHGLGESGPTLSGDCGSVLSSSLPLRQDPSSLKAARRHGGQLGSAPEPQSSPTGPGAKCACRRMRLAAHTCSHAACQLSRLCTYSL